MTCEHFGKQNETEVIGISSLGIIFVESEKFWFVIFIEDDDNIENLKPTHFSSAFDANVISLLNALIK
jgi:hypothetical protein